MQTIQDPGTSFVQQQVNTSNTCNKSIHIRRPKFKTSISQAAKSKIQKALELDARVLSEKIIEEQTHSIFEIESMGYMGQKNIYFVHIEAMPSCNCLDFQ